MSNRDGYGCLGSIISLLLLAVLWPYIVAAIAIYFAYLLLLELIAWIALNWVLVSACLLAVLAFYLAIRFKLATRVYAYLLARRARASFESIELQMSATVIQEGLPENSSIFTPSTNLYCYWCTKKLGLQSWERSGKYYCQSCYEAICKQKLDIE